MIFFLFSVSSVLLLNRNCSMIRGLLFLVAASYCYLLLVILVPDLNYIRCSGFFFQNVILSVLFLNDFGSLRFLVSLHFFGSFLFLRYDFHRLVDFHWLVVFFVFLIFESANASVLRIRTAPTGRCRIQFWFFISIRIFSKINIRRLNGNLLTL